MRSNKIKYLIQLTLLVAITIVLAATPLGFLTLGPVSFSILVLPVAVGSLLLGMPAGIVLGLAFGITSFIKAPYEALGILLLDHNLFFTMFVCIVPRLIIGIVSSFSGTIIEKAKLKKNFLSYFIVGLIASLTNTILFVGLIDVFCAELIKNSLGQTLVSLVFVGGAVEAVANAFLTASLMLPLNKYLKK